MLSICTIIVFRANRVYTHRFTILSNSLLPNNEIAVLAAVTHKSHVSMREVVRDSFKNPRHLLCHVHSCKKS